LPPTPRRRPLNPARSQIVGHGHITIQQMQSITSTALLNPNQFAFFQGLDFADGKWAWA
jgi:hypothetical protein